MSTPSEVHDYIVKSEIPSMGNSDNERRNKGLNLKATELRLGLPGSESPEREIGHGVKGLASGAKREFFDTIGGGSGNWVFSGGGGSEADLAKNGGYLSPRRVNGGGKSFGGGSEIGTQQSYAASTTVKEAEKKPQTTARNGHGPKAQVVGWPPVRSFRKNSMASNQPKNTVDEDAKSGIGCLYVKVSMDGAPYLRKVDLKMYSGYTELSLALEKMFSCFAIGQFGSHGVLSHDGLNESRLMDHLHGFECVLTYEDKDGDWMLVGDVPWEMFICSCNRLRIMKSSDAIGLAPRAMEKCKNRD